MNEVVKYDNALNLLSFTDFERRDFDIFMAVMTKMRDKGGDEVVFDYGYLMDLIGWDRHYGVKKFHQTIERIADEKLRHVGGVVRLGSKFTVFNVFDSFDGDMDTHTLTVKVSEKFTFLVNNLYSNFTRFELSEYISLEDRYSKQLYHQIKQRYKLSKRFWQPTIEEYRHVMSIPDSYTPRNIIQRTIKPTVERLKECKELSSLSVEVLYNNNKQGHPVSGFRFSW